MKQKLLDFAHGIELGAKVFANRDLTNIEKIFAAELLREIANQLEEQK